MVHSSKSHRVYLTPDRLSPAPLVYPGNVNLLVQLANTDHQTDCEQLQTLVPSESLDMLNTNPEAVLHQMLELESWTAEVGNWVVATSSTQGGRATMEDTHAVNTFTWQPGLEHTCHTKQQEHHAAFYSMPSSPHNSSGGKRTTTDHHAWLTPALSEPSHHAASQATAMDTHMPAHQVGQAGHCTLLTASKPRHHSTPQSPRSPQAMCHVTNQAGLCSHVVSAAEHELEHDGLDKSITPIEPPRKLARGEGDAGNACVTWGRSASQRSWGTRDDERRQTCRDAEGPALHVGEDVVLAQVYDGHGGPEVARFAVLNMVKYVMAAFKDQLHQHVHGVQASAPTTPRTPQLQTPHAHPACTDMAAFRSPHNAVHSNTSTSEPKHEHISTTTNVTLNNPNTGNTDALGAFSLPCGACCSHPSMMREQQMGPSLRQCGPVVPASPTLHHDNSHNGCLDVKQVQDALKSAIMRFDISLGNPALADQLYGLSGPELSDEGQTSQAPHAYGRLIPGSDEYTGPSAGSTAIVAAITEQFISVASVGDSKAWACCKGHEGLLTLSVEHKARDPAEESRILKAGGWVSRSGRVNSELDMSRSLGDMEFKQAHGLPPEEQAVVATADVVTLDLQRAPGIGLQYLIMCTDGLSNVCSEEQVQATISAGLQDGRDPEAICRDLCSMACASHNTAYDNVTVMLIVPR